ncbi:LysR family transcriptional regulator [Anaerosacchariphilus sp. NSJ-68]|uniref:LysR family transcriptional regulator n=2 Tax=Lachnospiraceae TaxID=186803 RepID=A0A923RMR7_9FIRM|nr:MULTISPECIES: LysR family transcriptional regulator [Lachnospiraceae]MBC5660607.1 LysR family transcriptional regulator [Anaerosacchariphilus hominis]MBC5699470.1 LysR family transcriptional regulator [Roseburia difficilis]
MFRGMEYVYTVYQEKSISRAAERLCISQPSLSANIKRIEAKVGYPLFDRSTKPLSLTECGEKYIRSVEKIMTVEREFSDYVNDWGELKTGSLVLGGSSLYASWVLPGLIGAFSIRYPGVRVELVEESTAELARLLQQGRIDMMLDNCQLDPKLFDHTVYREETLFLAVPRQFPSVKKAAIHILSKEQIETGHWKDDELCPVPLTLFAKEPFVMLKPENDTRKRAEEILRQAGITPEITLELDQQLTSYHVACSGLGIAFVSDTLIREVPARSDVVYFKLPAPRSCRPLSFSWKTGRYRTRAMQEFLNLTMA